MPEAVDASVEGFAIEIQDNCAAREQCAAEPEHALLIAFRGTEFYRLSELDVFHVLAFMKDLLTDVYAYPSQPNDLCIHGAVHSGFYRSLRGLSRRLNARLEAAASRGIPVFLAGHSLGGAVATLLAHQITECSSRMPKLGALFTFGSPCVGTHDFASYFNTSEAGPLSFRVVHGNDFVSQLLSMLSFFHDWSHIGHTLHLQPERNFLENIVNAVLRVDFIDHSPVFYAVHTWNNLV